MADTNPAPAPGERRTWPGLGVGVFLVLEIIAFVVSGDDAGWFPLVWLVPITPLAIGAWRWGPKGILLMIPVAFLAMGICTAIVINQIEW